MRIPIKEKTIGIIGGKRTGKTYYSRQVIDGLAKKCVVFDTIGALKPKTAAKYKVNQETIEQDAIAWGMLMLETKNKSITINMQDLTQDEIVRFTDMSLKIGAEGLKNKFIVVDEIAEMLSQTYKQSKEMERLVRHGGNYGNTFVFNTQRPAYISKNTFNLIDILIVFRLVYPKDLEVLKEILADTGEQDLNATITTIKNQKVGEYSQFVFGVG